MKQFRWRRPRPATLGLAFSTLVGIVLLLWGTDWLARRAAESLVARALHEQTGTFERPSVEVRGTFFLPQVLRGRYDEVAIAMEGVSSGPLRIESVHAELRDVYLSFHDLLYRNADRLLIADTATEALLTYEDLNRYLELTGRPLTVESEEPGELRVTGSVDVLGTTLDASADTELGSADGALVIEPTRIGGVDGLDRVTELLLDQRFTFRVPLDPLPFGQEITGLDVGDQGILVDVTGSWVALDP